MAIAKSLRFVPSAPRDTNVEEIPDHTATSQHRCAAKWESMGRAPWKRIFLDISAPLSWLFTGWSVRMSIVEGKGYDEMLQKRKRISKVSPKSDHAAVTFSNLSQRCLEHALQKRQQVWQQTWLPQLHVPNKRSCKKILGEDMHPVDGEGIISVKTSWKPSTMEWAHRVSSYMGPTFWK